MSRAERKAEKAQIKAEKKRAKKYGEEISDQYDESDTRMSHADAHRDSVYELPSMLSQIRQCYMIQMKRFTKQKTMWLLAILLILIPAIVLIMDHFDVSMTGSSDVNINMATYLTLMPLMVALICSVVCGSMLPQEFNERTVYLSLPLPMSRFAFYIGKFLSGLSLAFGTIIGAYGLAAITSMIVVGTSSVSHIQPMFMSMIIALTSAFFFCSFAYMMSSRSKRGSSMKPLIVLFVILPVIALIIAFALYKADLTEYIKWVGYIPCFGCDLALANLGMTSMGSPVSVIGLGSLILASVIPGLSIGTDPVLVMTISVACGILCLIRGYNKIKRRDM